MFKGNIYYSTNLKAPWVSFKEALLKGLAPDGGLYMPRNFPRIPNDELEALAAKNYPDVAFDILNRILGKEVDRDELQSICNEVYNFSIPIEKVFGRNYILRLDQGPTASFKDFAALLMAKLIQYFLKIDNKHITILTATSGDTGSAVANAFYGLENIRVLILYPSGEVSEMQRKQMTTLKKNIRVFAVKGKFDDCQKLVKKAFMDQSLSRIGLSSANSINIGRLLPQSVYYFWAWSKLSGKSDEQVIFSVPSGNFGNLTGGLIAREMGLPVKCFIVSTNENDEFPLYLKTGQYKPIVPSKNCISSAMNVGHPSNMARIVSVYGGRMDESGTIVTPPDLERMRSDFFAISVSDEQTIEVISKSYRQFKLLLEPHGAVAWHGLQEYLKQNAGCDKKNLICISLETAHPSKFPEVINKVLNINPALPDSLSKIAVKDEEYISLDNNYEVFRSYILKKY